MTVMKDSSSSKNVRPSSSLVIMTRLRFPIIIMGGIMLLMLALVFQRLQSSGNKIVISSSQGSSINSKNSTSSNNNNSREYTIAPGELPGYTGWARPEQTLAGYLSILEDNSDNDSSSSSSSSSSTLTATAGDEFKLVLQCKGHEWCGGASTSSSTGTTTTAPRFFVRAYGPAVLVGSVEPRVEPEKSSSTSSWSFISSGSGSDSSTTNKKEAGQLFVVSLFPIDPGMYTLEVVLTFSHPPPIESFPLDNHDNAAANGGMNVLYEGYLLPGFPHSLHVVGPAAPMPRDLPVCSIEHLTSHVRVTTPENGAAGMSVTAAAAAAAVARWKVTGMDRYKRDAQHENEAFHSKNPTQVSLDEYQQSYNSLGIHMDYQFRHCHLMPEPSMRLSPFRSIRQKPVHIIMIGDSVMRLQSAVMQDYINHIISDNDKHIRISFIELYGGYYRTQLLTGPMIIPLLRQAVAVTAERRVIVFNTGLHDIHRLCGSEWKEDRAAYLQRASISASTTTSSSCINLYRVAVQTMARDILQTVLPNDIVIFQTTSSAWPKYGNYGVAWDPRYGQFLPLDSSVVEEFNQVALQVLEPMLQQHKQQQQQQDNDNNTTAPLFYAVDGFWVSYARPDHRQVDEKSGIGKKLSHPGIEVISAMVRIWSMLMLRLLVG